MYSRKLTAPPEQIIHNGTPVFGSFKEPFAFLDIRGVKRPFGDLSIPAFITNLRIWASLSYTFITQEYCGHITVFDSKIFGYVEVIVWELKTGKKYAYRNLLGLHRRLVPKSTQEAVCVSLSSRRYMRISWSRKEQRLALLFRMKGDSLRPSISAAFNVDLKDSSVSELASVLPARVQRRCLASFQLTGALKGTLSFSGQKDASQSAVGTALLDLRRAYYPLRTQSLVLVGMGIIGGKHVTFHLATSSLDAADANTYNENALFIDGHVWPLPPVKITRPAGITGTWIIQDMESMVDLAFHPISDTLRTLSVLILRTQYHTIYGTFDGVLLTGNGEPLTLRNFAGIGKKIHLRY